MAGLYVRDHAGRGDGAAWAATPFKVRVKERTEPVLQCPMRAIGGRHRLGNAVHELP